MNRDNLGGYQKGPSGGDNVLQSIIFSSGSSSVAPSIFGTPAYWQGTNSIYVNANGNHLQAFSLIVPPVGTPQLSGVVSQSAETFSFFGGSPAISSNGSTSGTGVVWFIDASGYGAAGAVPTPAILRAYDAGNLAHSVTPSKELYDSSDVPGDAAGAAVKFTVPTVANGKVYVGTQTELSVYGLLP